MNTQNILDRKRVKSADTVDGIINGRPYLTFKTTESIEFIVREMHKYHQGAVGVIDDKGRLTGLITEHDILRHIFGTHGESRADFDRRQEALSVMPAELTAADVMTPDPVCLTGDMKVENALDLIKHYGFRFMPVIDIKDRHMITGLVSERELFWYTQEKIQRLMKEKDTCLSYFMGCEPYGLCEIPENYSLIDYKGR